MALTKHQLWCLELIDRNYRLTKPRMQSYKFSGISYRPQAQTVDTLIKGGYITYHMNSPHYRITAYGRQFVKRKIRG